MLRLTDKYEIPSLRREICSRIKVEWPITFNSWFNRQVDPLLSAKDFNLLKDMAHHCEIPQLLSMAYTALIGKAWSLSWSPMRWKQEYQLTRSDLLHCMHGLQCIRRQISKFSQWQKWRCVCKGMKLQCSRLYLPADSISGCCLLDQQWGHTLWAKLLNCVIFHKDHDHLCDALGEFKCYSSSIDEYQDLGNQCQRMVGDDFKNLCKLIFKDLKNNKVRKAHVSIPQ